MGLEEIKKLLEEAGGHCDSCQLEQEIAFEENRPVSDEGLTCRSSAGRILGLLINEGSYKAQAIAALRDCDSCDYKTPKIADRFIQIYRSICRNEEAEKGSPYKGEKIVVIQTQ